LEKAVELGLNYVDNNIATECDLYGESMAKSDSAKRDKWFIGFASWPQKVTTEYEDKLTPDGMMKTIEDRLRCYRTDVLDMWRPVGATWGEGQKKIGTMLMVSEKTLDLVAEVVLNLRVESHIEFHTDRCNPCCGSCRGNLRSRRTGICECLRQTYLNPVTLTGLKSAERAVPLTLVVLGYLTCRRLDLISIEENKACKSVCNAHRILRCKADPVPTVFKFYCGIRAYNISACGEVCS